jgi:heme-degrading monooxygenase HmoA
VVKLLSFEQGHNTAFRPMAINNEEGYMFVRHVSMRLKSGNEAEFNRIIEREVIPILKRQKGFRDEIVLTNPGATEVAGISFWEQKENAEAYNREHYPEVQQLLAKVLDGTPQVKTYEVAHSTIHKIAAHAATA